MKRIITTILCSASLSFMYAQSVLSIPFGSSYEHVKECLENRIGKFHVFEEGGNLWTTDISLGDYKFHFGNFDFQHGNYGSYLSHACFSKHFDLDSKGAAIKFRDALKDILYNKYGEEYYEEYSNDDEFKCYKFGLNPKDESKVFVLLTTFKGESNAGKFYYYVNIDYGPVYYIDKDSDF